MMRAHRPAVVLVGIALAMFGCGQPTSEQAALPEPDQVYRDVRGRVTSLPTGGAMSQPLFIRHEAIPDFVGAEGTVHVNADGTPGMKAMEMPFPEAAPGVSFDGIDAGDPVAFDFAVAWDGRSPRYWITRIEELPAGTELELATDLPAHDAAP